MPIDVSDKKLEEIVKGEVSAVYDFFAFKILLTRLQNTFKQDPETLGDCVTELNDFCKQHEDNPQFSSDIDKISQ